jgi:hypothetical protein
MPAERSDPKSWKENNMTKDLAPKLEEVLAEPVNWINRVTELAANENWHGVHKALGELDDEHLRSMIYVLVLARGNDLRRAPRRNGLRPVRRPRQPRLGYLELMDWSRPMARLVFTSDARRILALALLHERTSASCPWTRPKMPGTSWVSSKTLGYWS